MAKAKVKEEKVINIEAVDEILDEEVMETESDETVEDQDEEVKEKKSKKTKKSKKEKKTHKVSKKDLIIGGLSFIVGVGATILGFGILGSNGTDNVESLPKKDDWDVIDGDVVSVVEAEEEQEDNE